MITTKGRLLGDFSVDFVHGEIVVSCIRLQPDEQIALLIDHLNNKARINLPFEECQRLALQHQYELVMQEDETFVSRIERFLGSNGTE